MKKIIFIKNALILTVSSLILRFAGIIFKVWLAGLIGSEGIGLYQLVFSVYILAATFATSGICTAVTRLVAEQISIGDKKGAIRALRRSVELTLIIAILSAVIVFFGAEFIANVFIGDKRAIIALKILPLSLPFMGITSCYRGYFIAKRKVTPNAATQLFEQVIRIVIVVFAVKKTAPMGLGYSCAAVLMGDTCAEIVSCLILTMVYVKDVRKNDIIIKKCPPQRNILKKIIRISLPITSGRYLNTALRTAENILVPKNLAKCPFGRENALSQFGSIKGMALPILFFPSTLLNSLSTLLIPEMSEAAAMNRKGLVKSATENIIRLTAVMSYIFAALFFIAGNEIGFLIYQSDEIGFLLRALAPIVPLMYLDSICDGILKGLDQQLFSFRTSVVDSGLRIILILIFLPKFGIYGFIGIMYFSNLLTCFLNVGRLVKVSKAKIKIVKEIILPLISAFFVTYLTNSILSLMGDFVTLVYIILISVISISGYCLLLFAFGIISKDDLVNIIKK